MTWIGNIYQKFEAVCQEVDDIVSQETIKYVENHVQTVGESVKIFCSNAVQETKAASVKKNDEIGNYIRSVMGIENTPAGSCTRQSPTEDIATYRVNTQQVHSTSGVHLVNQFNTSSFVDPLESREYVSLEKNEQYLANDKENESLEKNAMKEEESVPEVLELISSGKTESSEASLCSNLMEDNCETFCASVAEMPAASVAELPATSVAELPATSVPDVQFEFSQKEPPVFTPFSDDEGIVEVLELTSPGERGLSEEPLCSELIDDNNGTVCASVAEVPPGISVPNMQLEFCQKKGPTDTSSSNESGSSEAPLCSKLIDDNNETICANMAEVPPITSVPGVQLEFCQRKGPTDTPSMDDSGVPEVSELMSPCKIEFFAAVLCNELIGDNHKIVGALMAEVLPATRVPDVQFVCSQKEGTNDTTYSDDNECAFDASSSFRSSQMTNPALSLEKQIAEMNTSSLVTQSHHLLEGSSDLDLFGKPIDMAGHISNSSSEPLVPPSESVILCKNEAVKTGLASSSSVNSLESLGKDTSMPMRTTYMTGSSGNWPPQFHCSSQFEAVISTSDIGHSYDDCISDIVDQEMETIELFDSVEVKEGGLVTDTCDLYSVIRAQKFKSYKKRFQELFTRKKRLVKEYEQLAVWHGDIDFGSLDKTSQIHVASTSTSQFDDSKISQAKRASDGEWELL